MKTDLSHLTWEQWERYKEAHNQIQEIGERERNRRFREAAKFLLAGFQMNKPSNYVDRLEEKLEYHQQREKDWQALASEYGHVVRKFQLGKTVNMQNWNDIQKLKNKLGIGNGVLKSE